MVRPAKYFVLAWCHLKIAVAAKRARSKPQPDRLWMGKREYKYAAGKSSIAQTSVSSAK